MLRTVSYPIARFFTSIAMGLALLAPLACPAEQADPNAAAPANSPSVKNLAPAPRPPAAQPQAATPQAAAAPVGATIQDGQPITAVVGFTDLQGKMHFLHDFKGKGVIVNLWASWCAPCVQEMPSLAKLQQDYAAQGLVVIAISEDDSPKTASDFYSKHGIAGLTPYFDKDHAVWTALAARGLPTSLLITRSGVAAAQRIEGPINWQAASFKPTIEWLLKKN